VFAITALLARSIAAAKPPSSKYSGGAELEPHHEQQHQTDFLKRRAQ
jgi:hypothetical protein